MAIPTAPTIITISDEAFSAVNHPSPSAAETTRAQDVWLEMVKKYIASRNSWKVLEKESVLILSAFTQVYDVDTDFMKGSELLLYSGGAYGTSQAGASGSITLAPAEPITQAAAEGAPIFITSGTPKAELARITAYDTGTKIATISPSWTNVPATDNYLIPDTETDITPIIAERIPLISTPATPSRFAIFNDKLYFIPTPNAGPYAILMRSQVRLDKVDLASTRLMRIYTEWETALIAGLAMHIAKFKSDSRWLELKKEFEHEIDALILLDKRKRRFDKS